TGYDSRNRRGLLVPVAAADAALGRALVDGVGCGPPHGGAGGGVSGVPAGAAGVAEHGEVVRAVVGVVVAVSGCIRAALGCGDVRELRGLPDLAAYRRRTRGRVDRTPSSAVCGVD